MMNKVPHIGRDEIDAALVRRLIAAQFPRWADLPVSPVEPGGWDNRTFHLGDGMSVRLPSAEGYAAQVEKEHRWLPILAPRLPLPIPTPIALGVPSDEYPWSWSVYGWLDGEPATVGRIDDLTRFAAALAGFLVALQRIDADGGPAAGPHSFFRGGPLATYDAEARRALAVLAGEDEARAALALWEAAVATTWQAPPVWVHGDVAVGNLLVEGGQLSAVIDLGCSSVGDPACDLVIAWTLFSGESRDVFRAALPLDDATWARGRGWALWKALITIEEHRAADPAKADEARRVVGELLDDHQRDAHPRLR